MYSDVVQERIKSSFYDLWPNMQLQFLLLYIILNITTCWSGRLLFLFFVLAPLQ